MMKKGTRQLLNECELELNQEERTARKAIIKERLREIKATKAMLADLKADLDEELTALG